MGTTITEKIIMTPEELLAEVDNAIMAILRGGQSYTIGSRTLTRADLPFLYKMRKDLVAQIAADNAEAGFFDDCYVAVWPFDR